MTNSNPVRSLRAKLLLSACAVLAPGVAFAQTTTTTNVTTATTATVSVDQADVVNVSSTGSIIATAARAITYNGAPASATSAPTINNSGTIQSTNAAGYGIETQGTFTYRTITINNLTSTSLIQGTEGGIRIRNGAGTDLTIDANSLITIDNAGRILGGSGGGITLGSIPNSRFLVTNRSTGTISGATGFIISQGTLNNSGTITGTGGWGVDTQNTGTGRAVTINNLAGTINGTEGGIRVRNGAGQDTTGVTAANLVTITNAGTIQGGTDQGIHLVGIPNTQAVITNQASGTIRGISGILADHATIDNYGLITGTGTVASGSTYTANNGEAIRLNGTSTSAASVITLYDGSTTTGTGSGANAIHVSAGTSTTVNVRSGATLNGDISIDSRVGIVNLDSGAVLNGNVDTDPGQMTVNLQTGATVTGQINGGAAATTFIDTLNLSAGAGSGAATLPVVTAFDRINVLSGDWTLANTAFATAQGIQIASGATVRYGNGGTDGAFSGAVENNGAIVFNRTDTLSPGSAISGTGTLTITGTGTLALQVANSYTGATTITDGRLRGDFANVFAPGSAVTIGASGVLDTNDTAQTVASLAGAGRVTTGTVSGGVLTTGGDNASTTYSGVVSGLGGIAKVGTGTLTLSGASTATGTSSVSGGALLVTGSLAGGAAALAGGTLGGTGTISGAVAVADGATLAPGTTGIGTLTTGALTLSGNAVLAYDLGAPGTGDRIAVNGDLVLDGTLNVTDVGGFGYGVYRLIDYSGTLTDNGLAIGTTPAGTNTGLLAVQTLVGQQVNLVYGSSAVNPIQFWDGTDTLADGTIDGGSGSWTNSVSNWTSSDGTGNATWGGNFAVFQGAAGTVTVDDAIGFGGMQFLTSGYTIAAGSGTLSANETLTNFRAATGITATVSAAIGGAGGIVKNEGGTLILAGTNSYAGATTVNGGTLRLAAASAIPATSAVTVAAAGTLDVTASQTIGSLAGDGAVTLSGGGLTAGGLNTATTFGGVISGNGGFAKAGTGTMTLTGANSYTGATSVAGGTLLLGAGGRIGTGNVDVASGATLNLGGNAASVGALSGAGTITIGTDGALTTTSNADSTFSGALTGTRATLTKNGTGTLTLSGTNTYSSTTTINAGRLVVATATSLSNTGGVAVNGGGTIQIATDKTIGALSGSGAIILGANRLTASSAQTTEFAGVASGTGGITKAGTGTLTLSGANLYTGSTDVTAGTLLVNGSVAGGANASGGTIGGSGAIAGALTMGDATLAPGTTGIGTLTVGGLNLSAGSILAFDFAAPGTSDRIQVNGNLVLDGTLNVNDAGGFGTGVYRLIDYTGSLTDNGLALGTLPAGYARNQTQVQTSVAKQVNLVVAAALPEVQFWDGANTTPNNAVDGGSGSWTNSRTAWTTAAGDANQAWGSRFAVFQGAAGTVTVDDAIEFTGMQFMTNGYTLAAGTGALTTGATAASLRVDPGVTATISAAIGGGGGLTKLDSGTLILSGANSYAGATAVNGGTLRLSGASALPATTAVTVASGATLDVATSQTVASLAGAGAVTLSGGSLTTGGSNASTTFDGVISGTGGLTKTGTGMMTLGGANTYSGATSVEAGTLALSGSGRLGTGDLSVASGATVDLAGNVSAVGNLSGAGAIVLGGGTLSAGGAGNTAFTGTITGTGGLTKTGSGNLTLSGANTYSGATNINAGTLTLGTATAIVNSAAVTVASGGTLALTTNKTIASLSGTGAVSLGASTLTLGSGAFSGIVNGTGALTKTGAGTLTLSGANTFTGATTVSGGTLAIGAGGSIAASSGVALSGADTMLDLTSAGAQTVNGLSGVASSRVLLGTGALTINNGGANTYSGVISGAGGLTKTGAGTLTLSGVNTYAGATTVSAGILRAGVAGAFGPGALVVEANGRADLANFAQNVASIAGAGSITLGSATLTATGAANTDFSGVISGSGGLTKTGTGTLTLSGANTYTGATTISGGLLVVNGSLASSVTLAAGGQLGGSGTVGALTIAGTVAPGNSIGTLRVNGNLVFAAGSVYRVETNPNGAADQIAATGSVTINGGTVAVAAGAYGTAYAGLTDYAIVTAGTTLTGTFAGVTSDLAFLTPSLSYTPTTVFLKLQRNNVSFASVGATPNQQAVGGAIDRAPSGVLYSTVIGFDAPTARAAFDNLSGELHADVATFVNRAGQAGARDMLDRGAMRTGEGPGIWIEGVATRQDVDAADGYAGIGGSRTGASGGVDYGFGAGRVGIGVSYARDSVDLDARNSTARIKGLGVAAYGGFAAGPFQLRATAGYANHDLTTDRSLTAGGFTDALHATYSGNTTHAAAEIGYAIGAGGIALEPFAGIGWATTTLEAATESGGAAALRLGEAKYDSTVATFGLRAGGAVLGGGARFDAEVAGRSYVSGDRSVRSATFVSTGQSFQVQGADFGKTGIVGRLGITLPLLGGEVGLGVSGDFSKQSRNYGARVSAGWRF